MSESADIAAPFNLNVEYSYAEGMHTYKCKKSGFISSAIQKKHALSMAKILYSIMYRDGFYSKPIEHSKPDGSLLKDLDDLVGYKEGEE